MAIFCTCHAPPTAMDACAHDYFHGRPRPATGKIMATSCACSCSCCLHHGCRIADRQQRALVRTFSNAQEDRPGAPADDQRCRHGDQQATRIAGERIGQLPDCRDAVSRRNDRDNAIDCRNAATKLGWRKPLNNPRQQASYRCMPWHMQLLQQTERSSDAQAC